MAGGLQTQDGRRSLKRAEWHVAPPGMGHSSCPRLRFRRVRAMDVGGLVARVIVDARRASMARATWLARCNLRLVLYPTTKKSHASAGNRTPVTSMATMYSATRPLMRTIYLQANVIYDPVHPLYPLRPSSAPTHARWRVSVGWNRKTARQYSRWDSNPQSPP